MNGLTKLKNKTIRKNHDDIEADTIEERINNIKSTDFKDPYCVKVMMLNYSPLKL